jgi:hypothetical protein
LRILYTDGEDFCEKTRIVTNILALRHGFNRQAERVLCGVSGRVDRGAE